MAVLDAWDGVQQQQQHHDEQLLSDVMIVYKQTSPFTT